MARLTLFDLYETLVYPRFEEIAHARRLGARQKDIAAMCGVGETTLKNMKKKYPELNEVLENSKAKLVMELEKSMFAKALAVDRVLLIFSLKNLAPDRWRDVQQVESKTDITVVNDWPGGTLDIAKKTAGRPKKAKEKEIYSTDDIDPNEMLFLERVN